MTRVGFVLEQTLGHIAHAANLSSLLDAEQRIEPVWAPIDYDISTPAAWIPGYRNWTVRSGVRARRAIRQMRQGSRRLDALFIHTQVPAILLPDILRRIPTVVSLDATPIQYDELGDHYGHTQGGARIEGLKWRANRACFERASAIVAWAHWTKYGLVERYEVPAGKVHVIPPGVDYQRWATIGEARRRVSGEPVRVLFVGGDFGRKGGHVLLEGLRRVRHRGLDVELDVVTRDEVSPDPGVHVHHGLEPNSAELIGLYHRADIFCLPTLGDCLPMVLSEAGAAGLPLVSTNVGAISEIVRPEVTGLVVPPGDASALGDALDRLATDEGLRRRLGENAKRTVAADFNAATNAHRLVDLVLEIAQDRPGRGRQDS